MAAVKEYFSSRYTTDDIHAVMFDQSKNTHTNPKPPAGYIFRADGGVEVVEQF